jgi:hypothetical protein
MEARETAWTDDRHIRVPPGGLILQQYFALAVLDGMRSEGRNAGILPGGATRELELAAAQSIL